MNKQQINAVSPSCCGIDCSREYIDILFKYEENTYSERIYLDTIDPKHYEDLWDYWFGANTPGPTEKNTVFEVTGNIGAYGQFCCDHMYINVYLDDDDRPACCITDILYRKSWAHQKSYRTTKHTKIL